MKQSNNLNVAELNYLFERDYWNDNEPLVFVDDELGTVAVYVVNEDDLKFESKEDEEQLTAQEINTIYNNCIDAIEEELDPRVYFDVDIYGNRNW